EAESVTLGRAFVRENDRWRRALTVPRMLDGIGTGNLCRLRTPNRYGRELPVATVLASGKVALAKWLKKAVRGRGANVQRSTPNVQRPIEDQGVGENAERQTSNAEPRIKDFAARRGTFTHEEFETEIRPQLVELVKPGTIVDWTMRGKLISIRL